MVTDKIGRRRLLGMAEVNRHCLLDMAVFLTWSLSSAICRRRRRRLFCTSCYIGLLAVPILPVVGSPAIHTKLFAPTDLHLATA